MAAIKKGVVIDRGGAGELDNYGLIAPCALHVNDKIYLYYGCHDYVHYHIGLAISEDGFNFIKKGVVIPVGAAGEWDDDHVGQVNVTRFNDKFYGYYLASNDAVTDRLGLAISEDGVNWIKKGVVAPLGANGTWDDEWTHTGYPVMWNDKIYLYYGGRCGDDAHRIGLAISEDGVNWIKKGVVLSPGAAGQVDDKHVFFATMMKWNDKLYMYYIGCDDTDYYGCLAISEDGFNFVKKGIVIPLGAGGDVDDDYIYGICALPVNDKIYIYYCGFDGANYRICLAISEDGF